MSRLLIILLVFLVACSESHVKPSQSYKPQGQDEAWKISGHMVSNLLSHRVTININDQEVIVGSLDPAGNGSLLGNYKDAKIESNCRGKRMGSARKYIPKVNCLVLIDDEESVTLSF
jgi:PBP1b-binding outer membrane lipoprotein LpoB